MGQLLPKLQQYHLDTSLRCRGNGSILLSILLGSFEEGVFPDGALADALVSGVRGREVVQVQVLLLIPIPKETKPLAKPEC